MGLITCRGVAADTAAVDSRPCEDVRGHRLLYALGENRLPSERAATGTG